MSRDTRSQMCKTCSENGRDGGYCAPLRCYCAHSACPAFQSWSPIGEPVFSLQGRSRKRDTTVWDERQSESWIDKL